MYDQKEAVKRKYIEDHRLLELMFGLIPDHISVYVEDAFGLQPTIFSAGIGISQHHKDYYRVCPGTAFSQKNMHVEKITIHGELINALHDTIDNYVANRRM